MEIALNSSVTEAEFACTRLAEKNFRLAEKKRILDWQKRIPRSSMETQHPIFIDAPRRERLDTHKELCLEYERIQCFLVQLLFSQDVRCCLEIFSG